MSETRTAEAVWAELGEVEERLRLFERLVKTLEDDQLLLGASATLDALAGAAPRLAAMGDAGDRRAEQAAAEAVEVLSSLRTSLERFVEKRRGLSFVLRQGLIPALRNRRCELRQMGSVPKPPEPEAVGPFKRAFQAARNALSFGHPA